MYKNLIYYVIHIHNNRFDKKNIFDTVSLLIYCIQTQMHLMPRMAQVYNGTKRSLQQY